MLELQKVNKDLQDAALKIKHNRKKHECLSGILFLWIISRSYFSEVLFRHTCSQISVAFNTKKCSIR